MNSGADDPKGSGCPIRRSTDQSLLTAPRGFSQRATSFIASRYQGIHQMPLRRLIPRQTRHAQGQKPCQASGIRHQGSENLLIPDICPLIRTNHRKDLPDPSSAEVTGKGQTLKTGPSGRQPPSPQARPLERSNPETRTTAKPKRPTQSFRSTMPNNKRRQTSRPRAKPSSSQSGQPSAQIRYLIPDT